MSIGASEREIRKRRSTTLPNLSGKLDAYEVNGDPVTPFSPFNVFEPGFSFQERSLGPARNAVPRFDLPNLLSTVVLWG